MECVGTLIVGLKAIRDTEWKSERIQRDGLSLAYSLFQKAKFASKQEAVDHLLAIPVGGTYTTEDSTYTRKI